MMLPKIPSFFRRFSSAIFWRGLRPGFDLATARLVGGRGPAA